MKSRFSDKEVRLLLDLLGRMHEWAKALALVLPGNLWIDNS